MLGNRDSEVGMLIEDTDLIPSYMDGKEVGLRYFIPLYIFHCCANIFFRYSTRPQSLLILYDYSCGRNISVC